MVKSKAGESASVVIILKDGIPDFKFSGPWEVHASMAVQRNFSRAYHRYMKSLRVPKQEVGK